MRRLRANSSGQLLIIAALVIALLISSTTTYIYELTKETDTSKTRAINDFILALKQNTKNAIISSLANVSNGGAKITLKSNLNKLSEVFRSLRHSGTCSQFFMVHNDSNYDSGTWLSWNTSGLGVSSAYANFTLTVYGITAKIDMPYAVNVTTTITINGSYSVVSGDEKQVTLICRTFNEAQPALWKNVTVFYESGGNWVQVNSTNNLSIVNYGNGTYSASFTITLASDTVGVSTCILDSRDIFVRANITCHAV